MSTVLYHVTKGVVFQSPISNDETNHSAIRRFEPPASGLTLMRSHIY